MIIYELKLSSLVLIVFLCEFYILHLLLTLILEFLLNYSVINLINGCSVTLSCDTKSCILRCVFIIIMRTDCFEKCCRISYVVPWN